MENLRVSSRSTSSFLSEQRHRICVQTRDARESSFLLQHISVMTQCFNSFLPFFRFQPWGCILSGVQKRTRTTIIEIPETNVQGHSESGTVVLNCCDTVTDAWVME